MEYQSKSTNSRPRLIEGVTFNCWKTGISRYEWRSEDGRIVFHSNYNLTGYYASVDGERIKKTFRFERTAIAAAKKVLGLT